MTEKGLRMFIVMIHTMVIILTPIQGGLLLLSLLPHTSNRNIA
jgi:hypothetical protein